MPPAASALSLSGDGLTIADAERLLHGQVESLRLDPAARKRVERSRQALTDLLAAGETIYGVNTGFGKLANQRIESHDVLALQQNLLQPCRRHGEFAAHWRRAAGARTPNSSIGERLFGRHGWAD